VGLQGQLAGRCKVCCVLRQLLHCVDISAVIKGCRDEVREETICGKRHANHAQSHHMPLSAGCAGSHDIGSCCIDVFTLTSVVLPFGEGSGFTTPGMSTIQNLCAQQSVPGWRIQVG
jgi:hypothetical protein